MTRRSVFGKRDCCRCQAAIILGGMDGVAVLVTGSPVFLEGWRQCVLSYRSLACDGSSAVFSSYFYSIHSYASRQVDHLGILMPRLTELRLERGSTLASFRDLGSSLANLRVLWLSACGIRHVDGVGALAALEELYLAFNDVDDLTSIALHDRLEVSCRMLVMLIFLHDDGKPVCPWSCL